MKHGMVFKFKIRATGRNMEIMSEASYFFRNDIVFLKCLERNVKRFNEIV